ncbi:MAG: RnfABCDGE type electron transport complex subunit B [Brevinematales bacterium]|nr:RnfABCDGE type electron transport complex subunit B [Brevinematales bacterium]
MGVGELVLRSVLFMGGLSTLLGVLILVFSKVFEVKVDPRIEAINSILPAYNCGSCGYPGCIQYATAVVNDGVSPTKCTPGGPDIGKKIRDILDNTTATNA